MAHPIMSKKKAHVLSVALFLIGLAVLTYLNTWWPAIMLAVGIPLALRQYLVGRRFDMTVSLIIFIGAFVTVQFNLPWKYLLPVLFTLGAIYIFFREFFGNKDIEEEIEDENIEIEEEEEEEEPHHKK